MGIEPQSGWNNTHDLSNSQETDAEEGEGGDVLAVFKLDRVAMLDDLAGATFQNNSSFGVPKAVVATTSNWSQSWSDGETMHGVSATGKALDADGQPLSGTAYFDAGGGDRVGLEVTGGFLITAPPPAGVTLGGNSSIGTYHFGFRPTMDGLDYYVQDIGTSYDAGLIQWGMIDGTITDYNEDPVPDVPIFGQGSGTKTDEDGHYSIIAPGGVSVELAGVGYTKERQPAAGETLTVDWQFARLEIELVTPDLEPIKGAPVQVGTESYTTDENGKVVVDPAQVSSYDVTVAETWEFTANIQQEGQLYNQRFGDEGDKAGCDIRVVDADTGEPIRDLPGLFPNVESWATSNRNGRLRIITDDVDEDRLIVGETDKRYRNVEYPIELTEGDTIAGRIEIDRNLQVSNR